MTKSIECEVCGGTGELMEMVCYGGPPVEKWERCETCEGSGSVDVVEQYSKCHCGADCPYKDWEPDDLQLFGLSPCSGKVESTDEEAVQVEIDGRLYTTFETVHRCEAHKDD